MDRLLITDYWNPFNLKRDAFVLIKPLSMDDAVEFVKDAVSRPQDANEIIIGITSQAGKDLLNSIRKFPLLFRMKTPEEVFRIPAERMIAIGYTYDQERKRIKGLHFLYIEVMLKGDMTEQSILGSKTSIPVKIANDDESEEIIINAEDLGEVG